MRLTGFDDMENYNNTMKSALNMLSKIVKTNERIDQPEVYDVLLEDLKNYFRSDMIHRRSKGNIAHLIKCIENSKMPLDIRKKFLSTLESNL